jgi:hypothetical protein
MANLMSFDEFAVVSSSSPRPTAIPSGPWDHEPDYVSWFAACGNLWCRLWRDLDEGYWHCEVWSPLEVPAEIRTDVSLSFRCQRVGNAEFHVIRFHGGDLARGDRRPWRPRDTSDKDARLPVYRDLSYMQDLCGTIVCQLIQRTQRLAG